MWLTDIARLITDGTVVGVLCACIVAWALGAYLRFRRRIAPMHDRLHSLCASLENLEGEEGFSAGLPSLERDINAVDFMVHPWTEFRDTLIVPAIDDHRQIYLNTDAAGEYFSLDSLLHERLNLRLYNALPNLFTGVGILGTFIGLVAGIHLASESLLDQSDPTRGLQSLLGGASLAFLTSIAGLTSSILFSQAEKRWIHRFEQARERWVSGLDSRLKRITPESVAKESLSQVRLQTTVLEQFTEQLAFQITEALETKVPAAISAQVTAPLTESLEGVKAAIEKIAESQAQANDDTIREIVDKLSESMTGAAGQEMRDFAGAVKSMGEQLKEQIAAVSQQQEAVRRQSEESVENLAKVFTHGASELQNQVSNSVGQILTGLRTTIGRMSEQMDATVSRMSTQLDATGEAFRGAVGDLTGSIESIRTILEGANTLMKYLDELLAATRKSQVAMQQSASSIDEAAAKLHGTAKETSAFVGKIEQASSRIGDSVEYLEEAQTAMKESWKDYEQRFAEVDTALAKTFKEMHEGVALFATTFRDYVAEMDEHTSKATQTFSGAISELGEAIEEMSDALEKRAR